MHQVQEQRLSNQLKNRNSVASWLKNSNYKPIKVLTNQYMLTLNERISCFKVCEIKTLPEFQHDSQHVFKAIMKSYKEEFSKKLGGTIVARRGYTIWVLTKEAPLTKDSQGKSIATTEKYVFPFTYDGSQVKVKVAKVKQGQFDDPDHRVLVNQMLNCYVKYRVINDCEMKQLGKGVFFPKKRIVLAQDNKCSLQAFLGYKFTICPIIQNSLYLTISNQIRILTKQNFLQTLNYCRDKNKGNDFTKQFIGRRVMKNYGNQRNFEIIQICYDKSPLSKQQFGQETMSYKDYFQKNYKPIKIRDLKQPLIKSLSRKDFKFTSHQDSKNENMKFIQEEIYLIPQLVSLTGMPENVSPHFTKQLRLTPNDQIYQTNEFIKSVNKAQTDITISEKNRNAQACILHNPFVKFNQYDKKQSFNGAIKLDCPISQPLTIEDALIAYSISQNERGDLSQISEIQKILRKAGQRFKIQIKSNDGYLQIPEKSSSKKWINQIKKDCEANGKPEIIIICLNDWEKQLKAQIQSFLTSAKIKNQFLIRSKLRQQNKGHLKIAGNIMIQIAAKLDRQIWQINQQHLLTSTQNQKNPVIMSIGMSIQRQNKKYVGIITNSKNKNVSKWKTQIYNLQNKIFSETCLQNKIYSEIKAFKIQQKCVPNIIIAYRMGLNNELFTETMIKQQVKTITSKLDYIKKNKIKSDNQLRFVYVKVIDQPSRRIYERQSANQQGRFLSNALNPPPGTILQGDQNDEFYLIAHMANQGTAKPTFYKVISNDSEVPMSLIAQFTYSQCYNYYNWQGSVRLPGCLQYCKKAHQEGKQWLKELKQFQFDHLSFI